MASRDTPRPKLSIEIATGQTARFWSMLWRRTNLAGDLLRLPDPECAPGGTLVQDIRPRNLERTRTANGPGGECDDERSGARSDACRRQSLAEAGGATEVRINSTITSRLNGPEKSCA